MGEISFKLEILKSLAYWATEASEVFIWPNPNKNH